MAAGTNITARITLEGSEQFNSQLDRIGKAGDKTGNQVRRALLDAMAGTSGLSGGLNETESTSKRAGFAIQNLTFQLNDVATSLASGISPMRTFAQQGGQIVQAFQQGGGLRPVLQGVTSAITGLITPMRLALAGSAALAAGLALLISRAANSEASARQFDVILRATGQTSQATGKQLEDAAQRLRAVGLGADEARKSMTDFLQAGGQARDAERIVRIGADLNAVLGEGSLQQFVAAAATGGEPLAEFARRLGIIPREAQAAANALDQTADATRRMNNSIDDALRSRTQALADEQRDSARQLQDLTRQRGTAQEELQLASQRRREDIVRSSERQINEILLQAARERSDRNAKALQEYNQAIEASAQKAGDNYALIAQIEQRVAGSSRARLGQFAQAVRDLGIAWNGMLLSLQNSAVVTATITALGNLFTWIVQLQASTGIPGFTVAALAGVAALATFATAIRSASAALALMALNPAVLIAGLVALDIALLANTKTWDTFKGTLQGIWDILTGAWAVLKDAVIAGIALIGEKIDGLIGGFQTLIAWAKKAADWIAKVFGGSSGGTGASADIPPPIPQATGGPVPGSGSGDHVHILAEPGEFMQRRAAVQYYGLDVMRALNSMRIPSSLFNGLRGYALGGLIDGVLPNRGRMQAGGMVSVASPQGGAPIHLHFPDGRTFGPLMAARDIARGLREYAVTERFASAGRKPEFAGG